jgi:hypothetical protein
MCDSASAAAAFHSMSLPLFGSCLLVRERWSEMNASVAARLELVHGEPESFVGGYGWQGSGPAVGSPGPNADGGAT